jgi:S1-C subfamily serine protease
VLGDFVVEADGEPVETPDDLTRVLSKHGTGDLELSVVRVDPRGGTDTVTVTVRMASPGYSLAANTH